VFEDTRYCGEVNDQIERVRRTEIPDEKPREEERGEREREKEGVIFG